MKKGTIIIGPAESGKSRLAREIASEYKRSETLYLTDRLSDYRRNKGYGKTLMDHCTLHTKLIIVEDITKVENVGYFLSLVPNGFQLSEDYGFATIVPNIVLVFDECVKTGDFSDGASFTRRFDIVDFFKSKE